MQSMNKSDELRAAIATVDRKIVVLKAHLDTAVSTDQTFLASDIRGEIAETWDERAELVSELRSLVPAQDLGTAMTVLELSLTNTPVDPVETLRRNTLRAMADRVLSVALAPKARLGPSPALLALLGRAGLVPAQDQGVAQ